MLSTNYECLCRLCVAVVKSFRPTSCVVKICRRYVVRCIDARLNSTTHSTACAQTTTPKSPPTTSTTTTTTTSGNAVTCSDKSNVSGTCVREQMCDGVWTPSAAGGRGCTKAAGAEVPVIFSILVATIVFVELLGGLGWW
jgi:hypothetical protein